LIEVLVTVPEHHFTDLRVAVTNLSDDDYQDLDVAVQPDKWNYKATILNDPGCHLIPIGGNTVFVAHAKEAAGQLTITGTRIGTGFDAHDTGGNVYTPLATESGYRLICGKFPAHFTIRIIFAVVTVHSDFIPHPAPGEWGLRGTDLGRVQSDFDLLDPRPSPSAVLVTGGYTRILKRYSIAKTIAVKDGN
jgi:hypothetical protein